MYRIKIAYLVSSLANEGPVNVLYNIISHIDFEKFDVSVITLIPEKETTRIEDFSRLPISLKQIAPIKNKNFLMLFLDLKIAMGTINPDIVHAHCARSLILINFLSRKIKKAYTAHIYPGLQQKVLFGNFKGSIIIKLSNYLMNKMDLPIACSKSVSQQFKEINKWNIKAIPNGCSLPIWENNIAEKIKIRNSLGLDVNKKYFIFIGRFSEEKQPAFLIETFQKLNNPYIGLILLGDGPLFEKLKNIECENIRLEGFKTNVYDYLIASDYYISASKIEGLANTLLESMTVGLPMLLSNIPSHQEVIEGTTKKIGILYNNSDSATLVQAIYEILQWPIAETSTIIKEYFSEIYTAQKMSAAYQKEYTNIVKTVNG